MEYVSGGNLTEYVTDKWESTASRNGLFLAEDEARYFFKVSCAWRGRGRRVWQAVGVVCQGWCAPRARVAHPCSTIGRARRPGAPVSGLACGPTMMQGSLNTCSTLAAGSGVLGTPLASVPGLALVAPRASGPGHVCCLWGVQECVPLTVSWAGRADTERRHARICGPYVNTC